MSDFYIGMMSGTSLDGVDAVLAAAKKQKIAVHVLPSEAAIKKFQDFARRGKRVVAHIHVGE